MVSVKLPKNVETLIKKESDKPEWVSPKAIKESSSKLVGISFRMDRELRENLDKILDENKKSRTFPYSLTDLFNQLAYEYVSNSETKKES